VRQNALIARPKTGHQFGQEACGRTDDHAWRIARTGVRAKFVANC
jgi:hypothetical protein